MTREGRLQVTRLPAISGLRPLPPVLARSRDWHRKALDVEPGGVQGEGREYFPHPIFIRRAKASRLWDVDGNEYIDQHGAFGASLLGYNDERVRDAVCAVLEREGVTFALPHPREVELAATIVRLVPCAERVVFTCEGTTAVYHATRVARAFSGKPGVLKFEGAYHGWHDDLHFGVSPRVGDSDPSTAPPMARVPAGGLPAAANYIYLAPWNDQAVTREIALSNRDEIGVIIAEPVMRGCLPEPGFLGFLRALANEIGAVLIFDEIVTGFRAGLGGAQADFRVTPDLCVLGKALANGFPIAAVAGRRDIVSLFAPCGPVPFQGTFNGHLVNVAAAQATLEVLESERGANAAAILTEAVVSAVNQSLVRHGIPATMYSYWSTWYLSFRPSAPRTYRDTLYGPDSERLVRSYVAFMLARGVYVQPFRVVRARFSASHGSGEAEVVAARTVEWCVKHGHELERAAAWRPSI